MEMLSANSLLNGLEAGKYYTLMYFARNLDSTPKIIQWSVDVSTKIKTFISGKIQIDEKPSLENAEGVLEPNSELILILHQFLSEGTKFMLT